jgi:hypothetical protein
MFVPLGIYVLTIWSYVPCVPNVSEGRIASILRVEEINDKQEEGKAYYRLLASLIFQP